MHRGKLLSYIFVKPLLPPHQALCTNSKLREDDKQPSRILPKLRQESASSSDLCPSNSEDVCAGLFQVQHLYWALCSFLNLRFRTTVMRVGRGVRHASAMPPITEWDGEHSESGLLGAGVGGSAELFLFYSVPSVYKKVMYEVFSDIILQRKRTEAIAF